jgi:hypothetical protein
MNCLLRIRGIRARPTRGRTALSLVHLRYRRPSLRMRPRKSGRSDQPCRLAVDLRRRPHLPVAGDSPSPSRPPGARCVASPYASATSATRSGPLSVLYPSRQTRRPRNPQARRRRAVPHPAPTTVDVRPAAFTLTKHSDGIVEITVRDLSSSASLIGPCVPTGRPRRRVRPAAARGSATGHPGWAGAGWSWGWSLSGRGGLSDYPGAGRCSQKPAGG